MESVGLQIMAGQLCEGSRAWGGVRGGGGRGKEARQVKQGKER